MKALHPSNPIVEVSGIPDESCVPSAHLNYQSTFTLKPAIGAVGTWQCDTALLPHPASLLYYNLTDSTGTAVGEFLNTQLTGGTHVAKMQNLLSFAQRWRLTYMSVTVYQDGPDLANQGTLAACQPSTSPAMFYFSHLNAGGTAGVVRYPVIQYDNGDVPNYDYMQNLPNSYLNKSKEGCYMPLRLTRTCQNWRGQRDLVTYNGLLGITPQEPYAQMPIAAGACGVFPFPSLDRAYFAPGGLYGGNLTSPMLNDVMGQISVRNMAVTTSLTFFVRLGLEIQCAPGTPYTPQLRISPRHDEVALHTYFAVARELKDAYPADHNDLGKIWDVIKRVIKTVAPALGFIPVAGPALAAAAPFVAEAGDAIGSLVRRVASSKKALTVGSAADVKAATEAVRKRLATPVIPQPQSKKKQKQPKKK